MPAAKANELVPIPTTNISRNIMALRMFASFELLNLWGLIVTILRLPWA